MRDLITLLLVIFGLVELVLRVAVIALALMTIVGLLLFLMVEFNDVLVPYAWKMAEDRL